MHHLRIEEFLRYVDCSKFEQLFKNLKCYQLLVSSQDKDINHIRESWGICRTLIEDFKVNLDTFITESSTKSKPFHYWSVFLDKIAPVLRDLTLSFREGDWNLHLSAIRRALPLFFSFDRINYSRWTPLYFEDCIKLEEMFPLLYEEFMQGNFNVRHTERKCSAVPIDQALEKEYNKVAKGKGGIIGFTKQKDTVAKWNLIKHEKAQYFKNLQVICGLAQYDEYSLHHEFSESIIKLDSGCVNDIKEFVLEHINPFQSKETDLKNIVTGAIIPNEITNHLLQCVEEGEEIYKTFVSERLKDKSKKLFDPIKKNKSKNIQTNTVKFLDVKKESMQSLKYIDYARLRKYDVQVLLSYELSKISLYLTKENCLRKCNKSELSRLLEDKLEKPSPKVWDKNYRSMIVFDFMAYARRVPVKKAKLVTFGEFVKNLWYTFKFMSRNCERVDIVFDLYLENSTKQGERGRRKKTAAIDVSIQHDDQPLPVSMDSFWASSFNKEQLQQFFIKWMTDSYTDHRDLYLGGCLPGDLTGCINIKSGVCHQSVALKCDHEEADGRFMFHINHGITVDHYQQIILASADTDIFICSLYHFLRWMHFDLHELWMLCAQGAHSRAVPIHTIATSMDSDVIDIMPAVHALTGCDTTSNVGTKKAALEAAESGISERLLRFAKEPLSIDVITNAEQFLICCCSPKSKAKIFDRLRFEEYHKQAFKFDLEKIPPTSSSIINHIKRAYYQCFHWLKAPVCANIDIEPLEYGYILNDDGLLLPDIQTDPLPDDFPMPCSCQKCAGENVCPCRVKKIPCCDYCKCKGCKNVCKNII